MNKYQKALNNLKNMGDKDLYNERHLEWLNTLQELIDTTKTPTLEEVKQEWIDNGWLILENTTDTLSFMFYKEESNRVHIYDCIVQFSKKYKCYIVSMNGGYGEIPCDITIDLHELITKTLKALEVV